MSTSNKIEDIGYMYLESKEFQSLIKWIESKLDSIEIQDSISDQIYYINSHQQLNKTIPNIEKLVSNINSTVSLKDFPLGINNDNTPPTEVISMLLPTYLWLLAGRKHDKQAADIQDSILVATNWLIENQYNKKLGGLNAGGWGLSTANYNKTKIKAYIYASYQAAWGLINLYEYGPKCKIDYQYERVLQSLLDCYRFFMGNAKPEITDLDSISHEKTISWPEQAGENNKHSLATAYALEFLYYFDKFCRDNHQRIEKDLLKLPEEKPLDGILNEELLRLIWEKSLSKDTMDFDEELIKPPAYDSEPYSKKRGPHTRYTDTSGTSCLIWISLVTQRKFSDLFDTRLKEARSVQILDTIEKKDPHITDIQYIIDAVSDFMPNPETESSDEIKMLREIYTEILNNKKLLREILDNLNNNK